MSSPQRPRKGDQDGAVDASTEADPAPGVDGVESDPGTIARQIDHLFRTVLDPQTGKEYAYLAIEKKLKEAARVQGTATISATHLWQLRTGDQKNPTVQKLWALATFFGVPIAYFFESEVERKVNAQLDLLGSMRDKRVTRLAQRAAGLPSDAINQVEQLVEVMRQLNGLPAGDDDSETDTGGQSEADPRH